MAGYIRQDTSNNISNNSVIDADDLDAEFNGVEAAFDASAGHDHDGTSGGGKPINKLGPSQDFIVSSTQVLPKTNATLDIGSGAASFKDVYLTGELSSSTLAASGNATVGGDIEVTGDTTLLSTLDVTGATGIDGNLDVNTDKFTVSAADGNTFVAGTLSTGSTLAVVGDVAVNTDKFTVSASTGNVVAAGTLGVTGNTTVGGTLDVTGAGTVGGTLVVTGATTLNGTLQVGNVVSNLVPNTDDLHDLGSAANQWKDLYVDGTANIDILVIGVSSGITSVDTDLSSVAATDTTLASAKAIKAYADTKISSAVTVTGINGLSGGGALSSNVVLQHSDTSNQGSVSNTGASFIKSVGLDIWGHVTTLSSDAPEFDNLQDYEEAAFTPSVFASSAGTSTTSVSGEYTRTGNIVYITGSITFTDTANWAANNYITLYTPAALTIVTGGTAVGFVDRVYPTTTATFIGYSTSSEIRLICVSSSTARRSDPLRFSLTVTV